MVLITDTPIQTFSRLGLSKFRGNGLQDSEIEFPSNCKRVAPAVEVDPGYLSTLAAVGVDIKKAKLLLVKYVSKVFLIY